MTTPAVTEPVRPYSVRLRNPGPRLPASRKHGRSGYSDGCRCDTCRDAEAIYTRERNRRRREDRAAC